MGASVFSNNSGELNACFEALCYFQNNANKKETLALIYDSKFSAFSSLGCFNNSENNASLIKKIRHKLFEIHLLHDIHMFHVKGHIENEPNEIADFLAGEGGKGCIKLDREMGPLSDFYKNILELGKELTKTLFNKTVRTNEGKPLVKKFATAYEEQQEMKLKTAYKFRPTVIEERTKFTPTLKVNIKYHAGKVFSKFKKTW